MVDRHVVKMILETAQLLSTAHRMLDGKLKEVSVVNKAGKSRKKKIYELPDDRERIMYSATHANHPSAVWARESVENYLWLAEHLVALGDEYTYRYGKNHKTIKEVSYSLLSPPLNLRKYDMTTMPSCMDPFYIVSSDPVENYRNYYANGKTPLHKWTNRPEPNWIKELKDPRKQLWLLQKMNQAMFDEETEALHTLD